MCPPIQAKPRARRARSRLTPEAWHFREWIEDERKRRKISLRAIARSLGYPSASRVTQYLRGKVVPGAEMIQRIAEAVGVSPIIALWRAGHPEAVFRNLVELSKLGWTWCRDDCASFQNPSGCFFTPDQSRPDQDLTEIPKCLRSRYHRGTIYTALEGEERFVFQNVTVPCPIAVAVLLAVGTFPRRGDSRKRAAFDFIDGIADLAGPMLREARRSRRRGEHTNLDEPLRAAASVEERRWMPASTRAVLMAEYVHLWAESCCKDYADYARFALYKHGGTVDLPKAHDRWEYQTADLPELADIAIQPAPQP